jgi:hypothetical protein
MANALSLAGGRRFTEKCGNVPHGYYSREEIFCGRGGSFLMSAHPFAGGAFCVSHSTLTG